MNIRHVTDRSWHLPTPAPKLGWLAQIHYSSFNSFKVCIIIIFSLNPYPCYNLGNPSISSERQLFDGKVFSIFWLAIDTRRFVLVCGPSGKIKVLLVNTEGKCNLTEQYDFVCPPSKQCWISAVDVVSVQSDFEADGVVFVCGDRRGSIHVFLPNYKVCYHPSRWLSTLPVQKSYRSWEIDQF